MLDTTPTPSPARQAALRTFVTVMRRDRTKPLAAARAAIDAYEHAGGQTRPTPGVFRTRISKITAKHPTARQRAL